MPGRTFLDHTHHSSQCTRPRTQEFAAWRRLPHDTHCPDTRPPTIGARRTLYTLRGYMDELDIKGVFRGYRREFHMQRVMALENTVVTTLQRLSTAELDYVVRAINIGKLLSLLHNHDGCDHDCSPLPHTAPDCPTRQRSVVAAAAFERNVAHPICTLCVARR